jgi:hypothetical protein
MAINHDVFCFTQQVIKLCDTNILKWKEQYNSKLSSSAKVSQEHSVNTFITFVSVLVHFLNLILYEVYFANLHDG